MSNGSEEGVRVPSWTLPLLTVAAFIPLAVWLLDPSTVTFYRDNLLAFRPLLHASLDGWSGRAPLGWNPWMGGGEPLVGDWNALAHSPLLATFLFGSFETGFDLFVFAHVVVAASGAWWLALVAGADRWGASIAAMVYGLGGPFLSYGNLLPAMDALAFAPWALGCAVRATQSPRPLRWLPALSITLALHTQYTDPSFLISDILLFLVLAYRGRSFDGRVTSASLTKVGVLLGAVPLALGLASAHWLPLLSTLADSSRGAGFDLSRLQSFSMHPGRSLELFAAGSGGELFRGKSAFSDGADGRMYLLSLYLGIGTLVVASYGAVVDRRARSIIAVSVVSLLLALGQWTPLYEALVDAVPGFGVFRYPIKNIYGFHLGLALAAALGMCARASSKLGIMAGGAVLCCLAIALESMELGEFVGPLVLAGGVVWGALAVGASWGRWLAVLTFAIDLGIHSDVAFPTLPNSKLTLPPTCEGLSGRDDAASYLLFEPYRHPWTDASPQESALYSWERGFVGSTVECRLRRVLDQDLSGRRDSVWGAVFEAGRKADSYERQRLFSRLGIQYVGYDSPPLGEGAGQVAELTLSSGEIHRLYEVASARPLVGLELERPSHLPPLEALMREPPVRAGGHVAVTDFRAGVVDAEIEAVEPSWAVVTQRWHVGWRARLDGREVQPVKMDGFWLAVQVPPGRHRLQLEFDWWAIRWGKRIALASWLGLLALCFVLWRRRGAKPTTTPGIVHAGPQLNSSERGADSRQR